MHYRPDLDWRNAVEGPTAVINPDQSRYLRIVWVNNFPEWSRIAPMQIAMRTVAINDDWNSPALMVDNTVIGLS